MLNKRFLGFGFFYFFLFCVSTFSYTHQQIEGYITDPSSALTLQERGECDAVSRQLFDKTGIQLATLIVPSLGDATIEEAANDTFKKWELGQKGKDNGVLLMIALQEKKVRIEVGYGLEGVLPDGKAGAIIREKIVPIMKTGRLSQGIISGHFGLAQTLAEANRITLQLPKHTIPRASRQRDGSTVGAIVLGLVILAMMISPRFRNIMLTLLLANAFFGGGSRGGRDDDGGGGFSGGGGGSSGGGGASGSW